MNSETSITMLLNQGLSHQEQERLNPLDENIAAAIIEAGVPDRCGWTTNSENPRKLQLVNWSNRSVPILELNAKETMELSKNVILEKLRQRLSEAAILQKFKS